MVPKVDRTEYQKNVANRGRSVFRPSEPLAEFCSSWTQIRLH
jgi:hypothetical protein